MAGTDFRTFRQRVVEGIEAELAQEAERAEALRADIIPLVADALAGARREGRCERSWLFGSFAWGQPGERSDVDLLVERCDAPDALAAEVWRRIDRAVHVVPFESAPESLVRRVLAEGKPL